MNPKGYHYGPYRVWGDLRRSGHFRIDDQPDISTLIRSFNARAKADVLGRSFQGKAAIRPLEQSDHLQLLNYAKELAREPRARLLPEERLEALLLAGDESAVSRLLKDEPAGMAERRRRYLMRQTVQRDRHLVEHLREMYSGECQICGWAPRHTYGTELCEAHHIRWLSRGGDDILGNLVLICPNHHRAVHSCDAPFDFELTAFIFTGASEKLRPLRHEFTGE